MIVCRLARRPALRASMAGAAVAICAVLLSACNLTTGGESGNASRVLMLYVVKGNAFLTIGVSGFANDAVALEKAKSVAQKLVERL